MQFDVVVFPKKIRIHKMKGVNTSNLLSTLLHSLTSSIKIYTVSYDILRE